MDTIVNHFLIMAAGSGSRYGSSCPKQFCLLAGRPLLMWTIEKAKATLKEDTELCVVLSSEFVASWKEMCKEYDFNIPHTVLTGGDSRAQSVRNALMALNVGTQPGWIAIHDGARPMVTPELMTRLLKPIHEGADAVIPVINVTDSLREVFLDGSNSAVDRNRFRAVQTPQIFQKSVLLDAYKAQFSPQATDDATLVESNGHQITLVEGDTQNIKVTYAGDITRIENELRHL